MPRLALAGFAAFVLAANTHAQQAPRAVSGIHPHLAMWNDEGECGVGAVVPWAGQLWVVTYAPHRPQGSSDKLYAITPELRQSVRPESLGGTVANRFVHGPSQQLFLGPHAIAADGTVRTIPYSRMFGRLTGTTRHLHDPEHKVVVATMEEGLYAVDVRTLAVEELWTDEQRPAGRHAGLPGYHGKGLHAGQGRYVYANNGDHARAALTDPSVPSGVLAEWDGTAAAWTIVRRNQFTDVTGPDGLSGSGDAAPIWSIGWDHRSLLLMVRSDGRWHAFRLPKSSHAYDGAHGWNTEWPRIRDIGEADLLMTMHGAFWAFPRDFAPGRTGGLRPRSNYLKVVADFCRWQDRVVLGCDDTARSEFLNKHPLKGELAGPGRSHSNLVFLQPAQLDGFGPVLARGALWLGDDVAAGVPSNPFLPTSLPQRSLWLAHTPGDGPGEGPAPVVTLEVDAVGDGRFAPVHRVELTERAHWLDLADVSGAWIRLIADRPLRSATAVFHARALDPRPAAAAAMFAGVGEPAATGALLQVRGGDARTLACVVGDALYELGEDLQLVRRDDAAVAARIGTAVALPANGLGRDAASGFWLDPRGTRWRLPIAAAADRPQRVCREVVTERNLLQAFGTFYEMPADNAGGFARLRPICSHGTAVFDYASYRGLLVLAGTTADAGEHVVRSDDGKLGLWVGSIDDLWQFGKPRGRGGPWHDSAVAAGAPSDPYLANGFDAKELELTTAAAARVRIEADVLGDGRWLPYATIATKAGEATRYVFPAAFGAAWLRLVSDVDTKATAVFTYR